MSKQNKISMEQLTSAIGRTVNSEDEVNMEVEVTTEVSSASATETQTINQREFNMWGVSQEFSDWLMDRKDPDRQDEEYDENMSMMLNRPVLKRDIDPYEYQYDTSESEEEDIYDLAATCACGSNRCNYDVMISRQQMDEKFCGLLRAAGKDAMYAIRVFSEHMTSHEVVCIFPKKLQDNNTFDMQKRVATSRWLDQPFGYYIFLNWIGESDFPSREFVSSYMERHLVDPFKFLGDSIEQKVKKDFKISSLQNLCQERIHDVQFEDRKLYRKWTERAFAGEFKEHVSNRILTRLEASKEFERYYVGKLPTIVYDFIHLNRESAEEELDWFVTQQEHPDRFLAVYGQMKISNNDLTLSNDAACLYAMYSIYNWVSTNMVSGLKDIASYECLFNQIVVGQYDHVIVFNARDFNFLELYCLRNTIYRNAYRNSLQAEQLKIRYNKKNQIEQQQQKEMNEVDKKFKEGYLTVEEQRREKWKIQGYTPMTTQQIVRNAQGVIMIQKTESLMKQHHSENLFDQMDDEAAYIAHNKFWDVQFIERQHDKDYIISLMSSEERKFYDIAYAQMLEEQTTDEEDNNNDDDDQDEFEGEAQMFSSFKKVSETFDNVSEAMSRHKEISAKGDAVIEKADELLDQVSDEVGKVRTTIEGIVDSIKSFFGYTEIAVQIAKIISFAYLITDEANQTFGKIVSLITLILPTGVGNASAKLAQVLARATMGIISKMREDFNDKKNMAKVTYHEFSDKLKQKYRKQRAQIDKLRKKNYPWDIQMRYDIYKKELFDGKKGQPKYMEPSSEDEQKPLASGDVFTEGHHDMHFKGSAQAIDVEKKESSDSTNRSIIQSMWELVKYCLGGLFTGVDQNRVKNIQLDAQKVGLLAGTIKNIKTIFEFFINIISTLLQWFGDMLLKLYGYLPRGLYQTETGELINNFVDFKLKDGFTKCLTDRTAAEQLIEMREIATKIEGGINIKLLNTNLAQRCFVMPYLGHITKTLEKHYEELPIMFKEQKNIGRFRPLVFYLHGAPGTGKSAVLENIFLNAIVTAGELLPKYEHPDSYCYYRTAGREFWDGYNGQLVVRYDDAFQLFANTEKLDAMIDELTTIANDITLSLNMASLTTKGNTFFKSKIIMINAQGDITDADWLKCRVWSQGNHLLRRRNIVCKVIVNKNYLLADGVSIDMEYLKKQLADGKPYIGDPNDPVCPKEMYYLQFTDPITKDIVCTLDFDRGVQYIQFLSQQHFKHNNELKERVNRGMKYDYDQWKKGTRVSLPDLTSENVEEIQPKTTTTDVTTEDGDVFNPDAYVKDMYQPDESELMWIKDMIRRGDIPPTYKNKPIDLYLRKAGTKKFSKWIKDFLIPKYRNYRSDEEMSIAKSCVEDVYGGLSADEIHYRRTVYGNAITNKVEELKVKYPNRVTSIIMFQLDIPTIVKALGDDELMKNLALEAEGMVLKFKGQAQMMQSFAKFVGVIPKDCPTIEELRRMGATTTSFEAEVERIKGSSLPRVDSAEFHDVESSCQCLKNVPVAVAEFSLSKKEREFLEQHFIHAHACKSIMDMVKMIYLDPHSPRNIDEDKSISELETAWLEWKHEAEKANEEFHKTNEELQSKIPGWLQFTAVVGGMGLLTACLGFLGYKAYGYLRPKKDKEESSDDEMVAQTHEGSNKPKNRRLTRKIIREREMKANLKDQTSQEEVTDMEVQTHEGNNKPQKKRTTRKKPDGEMKANMETELKELEERVKLLKFKLQSCDGDVEPKNIGAAQLYSQSNIDVEMSIKTHFALMGMVLVGEESGKQTDCGNRGTILNLGGDVFVMPRHYWTRWMKYFDAYENRRLDGENVKPMLMVRFAGRATGKEALIPMDTIEIYEPEDIRLKDIIYLRIKHFICGAQIKQHFVRENDQVNYHGSYLFGIRGKDANNADFMFDTHQLMVDRVQMVAGSYVEGGFIEPLYGVEIKKDKWEIPKGFSYGVVGGTDGDCCMLLMHSDHRVPRKIYGLHVAGNATTATGFAICLFVEDIEEAINFFHKKDPVVQMEPRTLVEYSDLSNEDNKTLKFLKTQCFEVVGKAGKFINPFTEKAVQIFSRIPNESKISASIVYDLMEKDFGPHKCEPAMLRPYEDAQGRIQEPLFNALAKYKPFPKMIPQKEWDIIFDHMLDTINCWKSSNSDDRRLLTDFEMVNGNDTLNPLDMSTSPGFPYIMISPGSGKLPFFKGTVRGNGQTTYEMRNFVRMLMSDMEEKAKQGIAAEMYWIDVLKDETRPLDKLHKPRIFNVGPVHYTLLLRKYFGSFMAHFHSTFIEGESAIGVNPNCADWDFKMRLLSAISQIGLNGDYKNYDGSLAHQLCVMLAYLVTKWYGDNFLLIRLALLENTITSYHILLTFIFLIRLGNMSGTWITTLLNIIVNMIFGRLAYIRLVDASLKDYHINIKGWYMGDDNLAAINEMIKHLYNMVTYSKVMASIGVTYTTADKKEITEPYVKMENWSFLKRNFHYDKKTHLYFGQLEYDVITEIARWSESDPTNMADQLNRFNSALFEMSNYGEIEFNRMRGHFRRYCTMLHRAGYSILPQDLVTYDYCRYKMFPDHYAMLKVVKYDFSYLREDIIEGVMQAQMLSQEEDITEAIVRAFNRISRSFRLHLSRYRHYVAQIICIILGQPGNHYIHQFVVNFLNVRRRNSEVQELQVRVDPVRTEYTNGWAFNYPRGYRPSSSMVGEQGSVDDESDEEMHAQMQDGKHTVTEEIAKFVDADKPVVEKDQLEMVPIRDSTPQVNLRSFLERPHLLSSFTWAASSAIGDEVANFYLPETMSTFIGSDRFHGIAYVRPKVVEITLRPSTTSMHYGRLLVTWMYYPIGPPATMRSFNCAITGGGHWAQITASSTRETVLDIPIKYHANVLQTAETPYLVRVFVYISVPLMNVNGTPANVYYSIFGRFKEIECHGYTGDMTAQSFNVDKPQVQVQTRDVITHQIDSNNARIVLAPRQQASVSTDTNLVNGEEGETKIINIIKRPGLIYTGQITSAMISGTILFQKYVCPRDMCYTSYQSPNVGSNYYGTPLQFMARFFRFWRGTINFHFSFISTAYHGFRLAFIYSPYSTVTPDLSNFSEYVHMVVDVSNESDVSFSIPFFQQTFWCVLPAFSPMSTRYKERNGILYVMLINRLTSAAPVVNPVYFQVFTSAGDDFEFAYPCLENIVNIGMTAQMMTPEERVIPSYSMSQLMNQQYKPIGGKQPSHPPLSDHMATSVTDILELFRMQMRVGTVGTSTPSTYMTFRIQNHGALRSSSTSLSAITSLTEMHTYIAQILPAFRFHRGSMRASIRCTPQTSTMVYLRNGILENNTGPDYMLLPGSTGVTSEAILGSVPKGMEHIYIHPTHNVDVVIPHHDVQNCYLTTYESTRYLYYGNFCPIVDICVMNTAGSCGFYVYLGVGEDFICGTWMGVPMATHSIGRRRRAIEDPMVNLLPPVTLVVTSSEMQGFIKNIEAENQKRQTVEDTRLRDPQKDKTTARLAQVAKDTVASKLLNVIRKRRENETQETETPVAIGREEEKEQEQQTSSSQTTS